MIFAAARKSAHTIVHKINRLVLIQPLSPQDPMGIHRFYVYSPSSAAQLTVKVYDLTGDVGWIVLDPGASEPICLSNNSGLSPEQCVIYNPGNQPWLILVIAYQTTTYTIKAEITYLDRTLWNTDQVLGQNGNYLFAGVYRFNNLTIGDNVEVTSQGISQLVLYVNGMLKLGKNATIRVRNGYPSYAAAPMYYPSQLTDDNYRQWGVSEGGIRLYPNMYGKGGNGGRGGYGGAGTGAIVWGQYYYGDGGSGGGGGGGGFGGGLGGQGGEGGSGFGYFWPNIGNPGFDGYSGHDNGGNGGLGGSNDPVYNLARGGGATDIGRQAPASRIGGGGGSGGGGNGADGVDGTGGSGTADTDGGGGGGGGGGGYGEGILTIIANSIIYDPLNPPKFLVSGQKGGDGNIGGLRAQNGTNGQDGYGGLLIIESQHYAPSSSHWNIEGRSSAKYPGLQNGGHGTIVNNPQRVLVQVTIFNRGFNLFSYPGSVPPEYPTCSGLLAGLGITGEVAEISRFNTSTQRFETCDSGHDFPIVAGEG